MGFKLAEIVPAGMVDVFICPTNKTPYDTKRVAQAALKKINPSMRHNMRSFRCEYCEKYHLGHRRGQSL